MIEYVSTLSTGRSIKCHPTNAAHRDQTVADVGALRFGEVHGKRFRATSRRSTPNPKQVSSVSGAGDRAVMNACSSTAGVAWIDSPALTRTRSEMSPHCQTWHDLHTETMPLKGNLEAKP